MLEKSRAVLRDATQPVPIKVFCVETNSQMIVAVVFVFLSHSEDAPRTHCIDKTDK